VGICKLRVNIVCNLKIHFNILLKLFVFLHRVASRPPCVVIVEYKAYNIRIRWLGNSQSYLVIVAQPGLPARRDGKFLLSIATPNP
jgi:hypothetical protein